MRQESKHYNSYTPSNDGQTMLCLIKAAKYLDGYDDLIPIIEKAAPVMAKEYSLDAWREDHDSTETHDFYHWSSMFFTEYYEAKYKDYELYGDYVIVLGHWMIETHKVLIRRKNSGYAFEGLISAYKIAQDRGNQEAMKIFKYVIDAGLYKHTQMQVGGPLEFENDFLQRHETHGDESAIGGVMSYKEDPNIRIDTTQHQMNALMMALSTVYKKKSLR
jgi:UDP-N-acetylmuramoyl-tripeptide--D-alanyl-D-alanine ligase